RTPPLGFSPAIERTGIIKFVCANCAKSCAVCGQAAKYAHPACIRPGRVAPAWAACGDGRHSLARVSLPVERHAADITRNSPPDRGRCTSFNIDDLRSATFAWNSRPLAAATEMRIAVA